MEQLPQIKFKLGDKIVKYELSDEVKIDSDRINSSIIEQPSKFAFIAMAWVAYRGAVEGAEVALKRMYAELDTQFRSSADREGTKVTEKGIESMVRQHPKYTALQEQYLEIQRIESQLQVAVEACRQRKDMLVSLASNYRAELESSVNVKRDEYRAKLENKRKVQ